MLINDPRTNAVGTGAVEEPDISSDSEIFERIIKQRPNSNSVKQVQPPQHSSMMQKSGQIWEKREPFKPKKSNGDSFGGKGITFPLQLF